MKSYFLVGVMMIGLAWQASAVQEMSTLELQQITGGSQNYCSKPVDDPNGLDCNECTSDGNGRYVKCLDSGDSEVHEYEEGQSPAQLITYTMTACGGNAKRYNDSGCTDAHYTQFSCNREYSKAGTPVNATGVTCPAPVAIEPPGGGIVPPGGVGGP